jgi:hypothetical protein
MEEAAADTETGTAEPAEEALHAGEADHLGGGGIPERIEATFEARIDSETDPEVDARFEPVSEAGEGPISRALGMLPGDAPEGPSPEKDGWPEGGPTRDAAATTQDAAATDDGVYDPDVAARRAAAEADIRAAFGAAQDSGAKPMQPSFLQWTPEEAEAGSPIDMSLPDFPAIDIPSLEVEDEDEPRP